MDWIGLIISFIATLAGLFIYLGILHTKWGKEHQDMQYAIMLVAVIAAVLLGGLLKWIFGLL